MDIFYELGEYKFEWDSEKAEKNLNLQRVFFSMKIILMIMMSFTAILRTGLKLSEKLTRF